MKNDNIIIKKNVGSCGKTKYMVEENKLECAVMGNGFQQRDFLGLVLLRA